MALFYPNDNQYVKQSRRSFTRFVMDHPYRPNNINAFDVALPLLWAAQSSHRSAKKGPEDQYWGNLASGIVPSALAGFGTMYGTEMATRGVLNRLAAGRNLAPSIHKWGIPIATGLVGGIAGGVGAELGARAGTGTYQFFNQD